jgi:hypothetical protein
MLPESGQPNEGPAGGPRSKREPPELSPLLVDIVGLSKLLCRSVASLHRDDATGRLPAGLKIGASKRWRYPEIVAWVDAGAPDRNTWDTLWIRLRGLRSPPLPAIPLGGNTEPAAESG